MHESSELRWIGRAESMGADLSYDYFIIAIMGIFAATIFLCWCVIIQFQLYQMCPGWGPIRRFDNDGTEEMRINQLLIHDKKCGVGTRSGGGADKGFLQGMVSHAKGEMDGIVNKAKGGEDADAEAGGAKPLNQNGLYTGFQEDYGSIGPCTWGYCESPDQWGEPMLDPYCGPVVVRHGFADTQWMRSHSAHWARDEIQYQQDHGFHAHPPTLSEESAAQISHRMVIQRGGY